MTKDDLFYKYIFISDSVTQYFEQDFVGEKGDYKKMIFFIFIYGCFRPFISIGKTGQLEFYLIV